MNLLRRVAHSSRTNVTPSRPGGSGGNEGDGGDGGSGAPAHRVKPRLEDNEAWLRHTFSHCHDVNIQRLTFPGTRNVTALIVYADGMTDNSQINETILPGLREMLQGLDKPPDEQDLRSRWMVADLRMESSLDNLVLPVFSGALVLLFDGVPVAFMVNTADMPERQPQEANTETSLRGPRDGFVESLTANVALVRKRLRTRSLACEHYVVGKRSQTKLGLLYLEDVIRPEVLAEVRRRLANIDFDAVFTSNDLEEFLADSKLSLFPQLDYTGRPDYVAGALLRGRFAILIDGVPTAVIAPVNMALLVKSAEDFHNSFYYVSLGRLLRLFALMITLFLPGFYIAIVTFHQDQIPLTLLAMLVMSRKGVPLPAPLETFLMLVLFELFREAGARMPSAMGQTLTVVGGLIIGDAAIRSGLTSPSMLVIIATTAVTSFTLVNISLQGAISILRFGVLIASTFLGIFGFLLSVLVILTLLARLQSFGVPFLSPFSPVSFRDLLPAVFRVPGVFTTRRPDILHPQDPTRKKGQ